MMHIIQSVSPSQGKLSSSSLVQVGQDMFPQAICQAVAQLRTHHREQALEGRRQTLLGPVMFVG